MTAAARKTVPNAPIEFVVAKLGLQLKRQGRELVGPCPVCGGHDRFAVSIAKQLWNCRGCGKGGDGIGLIRHVEGCSYREAVALLKGDEVRTFTASVCVQPSVDRQGDEHRRIDIAGHIWTQAVPLGPEASAYFERRGDKSGSEFAEADYEEWIQSFDSADRAERDSNKGQGNRGMGMDRDAAGENDCIEKVYEAKPRSNGGDGGATPKEWSEPDWSLLDDRRGQLPDFPLDVLSPEIRDFLERSAHGAGVMVDHVAVPLLSIASSLIGTSRRIAPSRSWSEPCARTPWTSLSGFGSFCIGPRKPLMAANGSGGPRVRPMCSVWRVRLPIWIGPGAAAQSLLKSQPTM